MAIKSEFSVDRSYKFNTSSTTRWIVSHLLRYKSFLFAAIGMYVTSLAMYSASPVLIGRAAGQIAEPAQRGQLMQTALLILTVLVLDGVAGLLGAYSAEVLAKRFEADAREELYLSLLGKSQIFHDRQRVGDIMARATDDVRQLSSMVMPGMTLILETILGIVIPLTYIAFISPQMLLVPLAFVGIYIITVRDYARRLNPVTKEQRAQFGYMNSGLEETISGIDIVKASAQEPFEREKYERGARRYRDLFVQQGEIEARYLPLLFFGIALALTFLHAMLLYQRGQLLFAEIIAVMGLVVVLRFPTFISLFSLSLVQIGYASAERILQIIRAETELDQNVEGYSASMEGRIVFDDVTFRFGDSPVFEGISFTLEPGQTVAIVGQTGSGKSTLTQLINRTYEATSGRVLIDDVDVRDWNLTALRSQISKIEQDVFLFSRSLAENIAFGAPGATREQVEHAAREAQAHDFILSFAEGYDTTVGERGVMLSGGQRQRIALARAFLSDPRILILDDSTSAIDSATEDEIQKAIQRAQQGRTTLLITHRLSQIRWADHILVLDEGQLVAQGTHDELLRTSPHYRRIFARYDVDLPPLESMTELQPAGLNG